MTHRSSIRERSARAVLLAITGAARLPGVLPAHPRRDLLECRILMGPNRRRYFAQRRTQVGASQALGTFERWVTSAIQAYVPKGGVAYDIGGCYGYHTLAMSRQVGPDGKVIVFEPNPRDRAIIERNLRLNHVRNTQVLPLAVGASEGTMQFASFEYPGVGHLARLDTPGDATLIPVEVRTLDQLILDFGHPAPDFVKIDVEGGEADVFAGARQVLRAHQPVVVAEVRWGAIDDIVTEIMTDAGYEREILHHTAYMGDVLYRPRVQR